MHKCDGCKYKSEHQEMGFKATGVCSKEHYLPDAIKAFNDKECRFGSCKQTCPICKQVKENEEITIRNQGRA